LISKRVSLLAQKQSPSLDLLHHKRVDRILRTECLVARYGERGLADAQLLDFEGLGPHQ